MIYLIEKEMQEQRKNNKKKRRNWSETFKNYTTSFINIIKLNWMSSGRKDFNVFFYVCNHNLNLYDK